MILWSLDDYYYYAFCIALISAISIATTLLETKKVSRAAVGAETDAHAWLRLFLECVKCLDLRAQSMSFLMVPVSLR